LVYSELVFKLDTNISY